jgi:hypothetical protein
MHAAIRGDGSRGGANAPVVLGRQRFYVPGRHTGTVRLKLTRAGRHAIASGKPVKAALHLKTGIASQAQLETVKVTVPAIKHRRHK